MDIQAAFDTISPEFIKERLYHHGGDKDLVKWYYNYLTHRNITTEIGGYEAKNTIGIGFPQGGVCSAKFWIIAFDPAIEIINQWGCKGQGFADDLCITMGGKDLDQIINIMQGALNRLSTWARQCNLKFSPAKTYTVLFNREGRNIAKKLTLYGKKINLSLIHI